MDADPTELELADVEMRLVDPERNRFRVYGVTECATLFGELCLRIVWGRIGNRRLRERSEVFRDRAALARRRDELLRLRRRHGYVSTTTPRAAARARAEGRAAAAPSPTSRTLAVALAILEAHGLAVDDARACELVARWHAATLDLARYASARAGGAALDLVDASTLAGMFVDALAA
jgi:predicted DNA-binding WGR domain protein